MRRMNKKCEELDCEELGVAFKAWNGKYYQRARCDKHHSIFNRKRRFEKLLVRYPYRYRECINCENIQLNTDKTECNVCGADTIKGGVENE